MRFRNWVPILVLTLYMACTSQEGWTTYKNQRFGYAVDVPTGLLVTNRAVDGSSVTWQTGTVKLQVSGANNPYQISPQQYYKRVKTAADGRVVTERKSESDSPVPWYEILYTKDGRRIHQRVYVGDGSINTVALSYSYRFRKEKESLGWRVLKSFRPGELGRGH